MTLPSSGPISLSQIAEEHGGNTPLSLSQFYRGASSHLVHSSSSIPATGPISLSHFYSTQRYGYYTVNSKKLVSQAGNQFGFNGYASTGSLQYNNKYRGQSVAWILWNEYDNMWEIALTGTNIPQNTITSIYHPSLGTVTTLSYIPDFLGIVTVWKTSTSINLFPENSSTEIVIL